MELLFMLVADYANTTRDDKLNIMGIFRNLYSRKFPTKHPQMYLVCQFKAGAAEYGRSFDFGVKLIDEDATRELINLQSKMVVPRPRNSGRVVTLNQVIRMVDIVFPQSGVYEFSVLIDNDVKGVLPLHILNPPEKKPPTQTKKPPTTWN